jgi:hypothetical protein
MDEARRSDTTGHLARRFGLGDAAFTNLVLFGYVLLATLIAGAASAGAGLAILALGLLLVLTLDFARWHADEREAGMRTGWELLETRARRASSRRAANGSDKNPETAPEPAARPGGSRKTRVVDAPAVSANGGGEPSSNVEAAGAPGP